MYAIIKSGGKQYRVEQGETIEVELLEVNQGDEVQFSDVLLMQNEGDTVLAGSDLEKCIVKGIHRGNVKDKKVLGFKYKPRSSSQRKRFGHRQQHALVEITEISLQS